MVSFLQPLLSIGVGVPFDHGPGARSGANNVICQRNGQVDDHLLPEKIDDHRFFFCDLVAEFDHYSA